MLDVRGFTYGFALGAGSMFLFDPDRGPARRARAQDSSRRLVREARRWVEVGARDLENRTRGTGARARRLLAKREAPVSEDVLVARVRSRLGRVTSHAGAIEVRFKDGNEIELKGPALASEHDRIVRAASRVRGVDRIDDDLSVYADADGVPGLQNGGAASGGSDGDGAAAELPPAAHLVLGASFVLLLAVTRPFSPTLMRSLIGGTVRALLPALREAGPGLMRRLTELRPTVAGSAGGGE